MQGATHGHKRAMPDNDLTFEARMGNGRWCAVELLALAPEGKIEARKIGDGSSLTVVFIPPSTFLTAILICASTFLLVSAPAFPFFVALPSLAALRFALDAASWVPFSSGECVRLHQSREGEREARLEKDEKREAVRAKKRSEAEDCR